MSIGSFFVGLLIVFFGFGVVYFAGDISRFFGKISWAEIYLGGTRQFYILFGIFIMVLGFLVMFGVVDIFKADTMGIKIDGDSSNLNK